MKLHLGCGKRDFGKDWIQIDGGDHPHLHSHDIKQLPFPDTSVDIIYACHVIEYFTREEIINVLHEWKRVLKPKGILRLAVPDFEVMTKLYAANKFSLDSFLGPLYGMMKMDNGVIYHKTVYDFASLGYLLYQAGFSNYRRYEWRLTDHAGIDDHSQAYLPHMAKETGTLISLNVECNA